MDKMLYLVEFFLKEADALHWSLKDDIFYNEAIKLFKNNMYDELVVLCLMKEDN